MVYLGSLQFNCLYRWHATTSQADEQWTQGVFNNLFEGKSVDDITLLDFQKAAYQAEHSLPEVPQWTFGGYVILLISDGIILFIQSDHS
jgi:linoleate 10R-lipoxygenase